MTIGGYDHVKGETGEPVPLQLHLQQYRRADLNATEMEFVLDGHLDDLHCKSEKFLKTYLMSLVFCGS